MVIGLRRSRSTSLSVMSVARGRSRDAAGRNSQPLQYTAQVPAFLQRLHSQVHGTQFVDRTQTQQSDDNELDPVMAWLDGEAGSQPSKPVRQARSTDTAEDDPYDSEHDADHAQIVVLKKGKHLTPEEYAQAKGKEPALTNEIQPSSTKEPSAPRTEVDAPQQAASASHELAAQTIAGPGCATDHKPQAKRRSGQGRTELEARLPQPRKKTKRDRRPGAGLSFNFDES